MSEFLTKAQARAVRILSERGGLFYGVPGQRWGKETEHRDGKFIETDGYLDRKCFYAVINDAVEVRPHPYGHHKHELQTVQFKVAGELINKGIAKIDLVIRNEWVLLVLTELGRRVALDLSLGEKEE